LARAGDGRGKLAPAELERRVFRRLGADRSEVLIGPRVGSDTAIVRVGAGQVLAITADPLSLIPALGPERSAWLSVHHVASDLWTSGIAPAWATVTLNLPPTLEPETLDRYLQAMHQGWSQLGVAVVAGHTGHYDGCDLTIVGAATLVGAGREDHWVGGPFVRPGDHVIVTKGCAIEATAIAAHLFPERLRQHVAKLTPDDEVAPALARARATFDQVSVVEDCRAALAGGVRDQGVTALHDATEGGVLGGLAEFARAAGCDLRVARARIPLSLEARAACAAFGIDPYQSLSSGTLLVAVRPAHAERVLGALGAAGIEAARVGEFVAGQGTLWLEEPDGMTLRVAEPPLDPYWQAYARAVAEGWS
jgi:hydrogenase maturation factor